ncbi:hypothetical protein IH992_03580 [Candidatus Poribacteria bacterium]|nr:hypothetical protein [Candidatus Poribacteria bacterium]
MKVLKQPLDVLFLIAVILSCFVLYGCGAASLGPQEPLLPTIEGQAKFSDRFQLEEEPQFFYDLFGKELLEGNEVHNYRERKEFNKNGELVVGWTGQLDSERFSAQLDRTILTEDSFRGRYTEFAIGDDMRIKPSTLFPNRYIMYKTEFDGLRWDISFSQERHLFTLLNSRISNPVKLSDAAANLAPTLGRRNGFNEDAGVRHIENARLIGFRAQGLLGDIFRVGFTYMNLHKEHPERIENPLMGTVANTPPERIAVVFRDDSPEDNHPIAFQGLDPDADVDRIQGGVGVAFKEMKIRITTQALEELTPEEIEDGAEAALLPDEDRTIDVFIDDIKPVGNSQIRDSVDGQWKIVDGFDTMVYELVFADHDIDPRTVKAVEFEMMVAGDYNIVVVGFSEANRAEDFEIAEWIKTSDGHIEMPFRDVIEAPGNYGQSSDYSDNRASKLDNPSSWKDTGRPRKIRYRYGAARGALLYGVDLEGTLFNTFIRMHYSVNSKFKQYPTIPKDKIGFSRVQPTIINIDGDEEDTGVFIDPATGLTVDANNIPTFSQTQGEKFESKQNGDPDDNGDMGREVAWFINLRQRFGKLLLEETFYHIDPGYTTTYLNFGANTDRDQTYSLNRTPESQAEISPFDEFPNYMLIEDDDDDDDWPDDIDFDGVLPRADDRDQNGILDFQEDFLIFEADPPVFTDVVDLNNNGTIDSLEDDFEPEFEYGSDRQGYHITAAYDLLDNLTFKFGWLNEDEVSSRRQNDSKYLHVIYQRDIPDFGTILFQNRFVRVRDDIPDYSITLRVGELEEIETSDELDFFNARVNTSTLQFLYTALPNLTLEAKFLVVLQKQFEPDAEDAIALDIPFDEINETGTERNERVDYVIPIVQVRESGGKRDFPFYPDHGLTPVQLNADSGALEPGGDVGLIYDPENWKARAYPEKTIRNQITILKAKYEIPLGDLPFVEKIGEDLTLTPMVKYIWDKAFDHTQDDVDDGTYVSPLNPRLFVPTDQEPIEYLRFNRKSREDVMGVRLDYQFTQRMNILGGFQYRKFTNRDGTFKEFLGLFPADEDAPILFRPDQRTRIFEIQAINRGEWLGFNIVILAGFRRTTILLERTTSNTTFVRAMMGF